SWLTWVFFALGVVAVTGVMVWSSNKMLGMEAAQQASINQKLHDENIRLALWRMDSEISPAIADEISRPYFHYTSFYPAESAYTQMFQPLDHGEVLMPSPLLNAVNEHVLLYFQFDPEGNLTSPQAPTGNMQDLAEEHYVAAEGITQARLALGDLEGALALSDLTSQVSPAADPLELNLPDMVYADTNWAAQAQENKVSYANRANLHKKTASKKRNEQINEQQMQQNVFDKPELNQIKLREGPMTAIWVKGQLIIARRISLNENEYIQGALLDIEAIKRDLKNSAGDLLPNVSFKPVTGKGAEEAGARRLAVLPIEVLPCTVTLDKEAKSPLSTSIAIAWGALLVAVLGMGFVLRRTMALSERRADFVSAVTHELRTPLTTFRMYTEMLASGKITDPAKQQKYAETLHSESLRLGHLIENVLSFARIEKGNGLELEPHTSIASVIKRVREQLDARAAQVGMTIVADEVEGKSTIDSAALGQVIFNLVDNACKYARGAEDKRIVLKSRVECGFTVTTVQDFGQGIAAFERESLFQPFRKSAMKAANTAPGVGLGLALCRRIIKQMGGKISALDSDTGCVMEIRLPSSSQ
ncbi:MAG: HAMP domain-containing histidine kinase, partial [Planctomycetes bacterium]|nr:HAMP domain-containing histidine kinase [Planctomycetota bacterium]